MIRSIRRVAPAAALLALPLGYLLLFGLYPFSGMIRRSFEGLDADSLSPLYRDSYYLGRLWFTTWQAAASTAITLIIAVPCAGVMARHEFRGKSTVMAIATIPFVLPTLVVGIAFTAAFGPDGWLNGVAEFMTGRDDLTIDFERTIWIILAAHAFYNIAMATRIIAAYWSQIDPSMEEAAALLGAGRTQRFLRITLPLLRTPIAAAGSLVFLFCFTSFGVVLVLGGPGFETLETQIYRETVYLFRLPIAATLAMVQAVFTFAMMTVYSRFQRGGAAVSGQRRSQRPLGRGDRLAIGLAVAVLLGVALIPLGALTERSLRTAGGYSLSAYTSLGDNPRNQIFFVTPLVAVKNSLLFAGAATVIAVVVGTFAALGCLRTGRLSPLLEGSFLLPLGLSAVTVGLGFLLTFTGILLPLRGSPWLTIFAHALAGYPFVLRAAGAQLRTIDPRLRDAARTLGANGWEVMLRIDLPLAWKGVLAGAVFAFGASLGEFGATLLIARPEWPTIPIAIFRYFGQPGAQQYSQALAMSVILMVASAAGFLIIDRLRLGNAATF